MAIMILCVCRGVLELRVIAGTACRAQVAELFRHWPAELLV